MFFPEVQLLPQELYNKWILWQDLGIFCRTEQYSLLSALSYGLLLTDLELVSASSKALIQQSQVGICVMFCWF